MVAAMTAEALRARKLSQIIQAGRLARAGGKHLPGDDRGHDPLAPGQPRLMAEDLEAAGAQVERAHPRREARPPPRPAEFNTPS